jgi:hypothetical protein
MEKAVCFLTSAFVTLEGYSKGRATARKSDFLKKGSEKRRRRRMVSRAPCLKAIDFFRLLENRFRVPEFFEGERTGCRIKPM